MQNRKLIHQQHGHRNIAYSVEQSQQESILVSSSDNGQDQEAQRQKSIVRVVSGNKYESSDESDENDFYLEEDTPNRIKNFQQSPASSTQNYDVNQRNRKPSHILDNGSSGEDIRTFDRQRFRQPSVAITFGGGPDKSVSASHREPPQGYKVKEFYLGSERDYSHTTNRGFRNTIRQNIISESEESDGGTFGKPKQVIQDWIRAKKAVDINLQKKESKLQEALETKQKRYEMIKAHNEQPSEQVGEDSESSLDLASDSDPAEERNSEENQIKPETPEINNSVTTEQKTPLRSQTYYTNPRTKIDFKTLSNYLKRREIPCIKFNYSLASLVQNNQTQFATCQLSKDGLKLIINNLKVKEYEQIEALYHGEDNRRATINKQQTEEDEENSEEEQKQLQKYNSLPTNEKNEIIVKQIIGEKQWDDRMRFKRDKSDCTCKISEIKSFTYGGFSSRFWLLRKHINSMQINDLLDLPFYCWECITISTEDRDINLVFKNQKDMTTLLEFLIISLKTCNGQRGSAIEWLKNLNGVPDEEKSFFQRIFGQNKKPEYISEDASLPQEQSIYLKIIKFFNLMRIRMKISYMALIKKMTIRELFFASISKTFKQLQKCGSITYKFLELDTSTFYKMVHGKANIKLVAWQKLQQMSPEERKVMQGKFKTFAEIYNDFLQKEITSITKKDKCPEIFRDVENHLKDDFEKLHINMTNYYQYKFERAKKLQVLSRIDLITKLPLLQGQQYITAILTKYKITKEIFVMDLELGHSIQIPKLLQQPNLPHSFSYYDPIIQIVQSLVSHKKSKLLGTQMAVIRELDDNYTYPVLFGFKKPGKQNDAKQKLAQQAEKGPTGQMKNNIDYKLSLHTKQIQRSKYLKIDDNLLNFDLQRKFGFTEQKSKPLTDQKIDGLKGELHRVHVKYVSKESQEKWNYGQIKQKKMFLQQLINLKNKGNMLQATNKANVMIRDNYPVLNHEDHLIMKEYQKFSSNRIERKMIKSQMQQLEEITKLFKISKTFEQKIELIQHYIELNIKFFTPKYQQELEEYSKLLKRLKYNAKVLDNKVEERGLKRQKSIVHSQKWCSKPYNVYSDVKITKN